MEKRLHKNNWTDVSERQLNELVNAFLAPITIYPALSALDELKRLKTATIEVIENRSMSTIYRIRETGVIYETRRHEVLTFESFENYLRAEKIDDLITSYSPKEPVHVISEENGKPIITRIKKPPFKAEYSKVSGQIEIGEIVWGEDVEDQKKDKLIMKAIYFLKSNT